MKKTKVSHSVCLLIVSVALIVHPHHLAGDSVSICGVGECNSKAAADTIADPCEGIFSCAEAPCTVTVYSKPYLCVEAQGYGCVYGGTAIITAQVTSGNCCSDVCDGSGGTTTVPVPGANGSAAAQYKKTCKCSGG